MVALKGKGKPQLIIDDKKNKSKAKPDFASGKKKYTAKVAAHLQKMGAY